MSGGAFDYDQERLTYIADEIESVVKQNKKTRNKLHEELGREDSTGLGMYRGAYIDYMDDDDAFRIRGTLDYDLTRARQYIKEHNEECPYDFSKKTIAKFKRAVKLLREAYVYAHAIDWLLSGDDSEESFHRNLKADLEKLKDEDRKQNAVR